MYRKGICAVVKKPTITETVRLTRLCWFGRVQRMEENRIPKRVKYTNFGTIRLRGRPRNRWQDEVRDVGKLIGGDG
jgi:hypothetical protein